MRWYLYIERGPLPEYLFYTYLCGGLSGVGVAHGLEPLHDGVGGLAVVLGQIHHEGVGGSLHGVTLIVVVLLVVLVVVLH